MKPRNTLYVRVLLVVLAIVILLVFTNRSPQQVRHDTWLPSSFNPVGSGHKALFDTLQKLHWPVERWREPLSRLNAAGKDNLLVITRSRLGSPVSFTEQEVDLLDDWVKRGNTLVLLGAFSAWDDTRQLWRQIGFQVPERSPSVSDFWDALDREKSQSIQPEGTTAALSGSKLFLPKTEPLPFFVPLGGTVLYEKEGGSYLMEFPRGAGRIICGTSERLLSSEYLDKGDNLSIVLSLLRPHGQMPGKIFFEESHHGYSAAYAAVRLLGHPGVRFAGMLALLGVLAFVASSLVRFGGLVPLHRPAGRSTVEFVDSIADLYLRADLRNDTIRTLFRDTHQHLLQRLNLPPSAGHALISSRLEQAQPHLPPWKKLAQRFDSPDYVAGLPPSGWLRVARELIEIKTATA